MQSECREEMYKSLYSRLKRIGLKNILIFLTIFLRFYMFTSPQNYLKNILEEIRFNEFFQRIE